MLIDDFLNERSRLEVQYGKNVVLLYQVGSFFEFYSIEDDPSSLVYEVTSLLNVVLTRKNKTIRLVSRSNPLMAGIPVGALQKYLPILIQNNYTVALSRQVQARDGSFSREVSEIVSPGTWCDKQTQTTDPSGRGTFLAIAWFETGIDWVGVGLAALDPTIGVSMVTELNASGPDRTSVIEKAERMLRLLRARGGRSLGRQVDGFFDGGCTSAHRVDSA